MRPRISLASGFSKSYASTVLSEGSIFSHYKIISRIGEGGMGEVLLAVDTSLERTVALKILRQGTRGDPERMRRFLQEARAVAALNHPNIAQIYEVGEHEGVWFIAMEYVEGVTLFEKLESGPLDAEVVLDLAIQLADALDEAHGKAIIHRDIKPRNLILTPRGTLKVLDFGLAKMAGLDGNNASTVTNPGMVVGTAEYMSPEQALGMEVDSRSDIFSLGAVLYEMCTGKRAFTGATQAGVFDAILNRTPPPPHEQNSKATQELERVIYKALEKDRELRYQTVSDLRADLKRVRRDSSSGRHEPAVRAQRSKRAIIYVAAVGVLAAGVLFAIRALRPTNHSPPDWQMVPLTSFPGIESQPSFSPDGSQVAFSWNGEKEDDWEIYVKVVGAGTPLRLTNNPATDSSPAWSPDGRHIAFLRQGETGAAFYLLPALGGLERKLSDAHPLRIGVESPFVAWSPDSKTLALVDKEKPEEPLAIYLFHIESGKKIRLTSPPARWLGDSSPVFSADGTTLAFVRTVSAAVQDIYVIPVAGGEPKAMTSDKRRIFGMAYNYFRGEIIFSSNRNSIARLWRIARPGGEPQPLMGIGENASFLAVSRRGNRLAYSRSITDTNVWRYPLGISREGRTDPVRLISSTRQEQGPKYSPDGSRIAFASNRTGSMEIWICDREGLNANQLTSFGGPPTGSPSWSPDGRWIVFDSRPEGNADIYRIASEGGTPQRLTSESSSEVVPSCSRDGRWIYFASNRTNDFQLWKLPATGGEPVQVTKSGGFHGSESPDGRYIYYAKALDAPGLWRLPAAGGAETPVLKSFRAGYWAYWAVVAEGVYFLDRQETSPEGQPIYSLKHLIQDTGEIRPVSALDKRPFNSGLAISPDKKWFLYTQVDASDTDILLIENFR